MNENVQITRRRAAHSRFAFARKADARARIHAWWDFDIQRLSLVHPAFTLTDFARIFENNAAAIACRARPLDHEQALLGANSAASTACGAGALTRAGRSA